MAMGPDGTSEADQLILSNSSWGYPQAMGMASGTSRVVSWYVRSAPTGSNYWQTNINGSFRMTGATSTIWERREHITSSAIGNIYPGDCSGGSYTGPMNNYLDLCQIESGTFPSSPIRTTTLAGVRAADVFSFAVGQYPKTFGTQGFAFEFAPDFLPSDLGPSFTPMLINGMDAGSVNDGVLLSYLVLGSPRLFVDAATKNTGIFTWETRGQKMRVEVRPPQGTITISGATTGNGVHSVGAWIVPCDQTMWIGSRGSSPSSNIEFFGRFGIIIEGL